MIRTLIVFFLLYFILGSMLACTADEGEQETIIKKLTFHVRPDHPRLFMNKDNISELRIRAKEANQTGYRYILSRADKEIQKNSGGFCCAFVYALGKIPGFQYKYSSKEYGKAAARGLMEYVRQPKSRYVADLRYYPHIIIYDWVYDILDLSERREFVNWCISKVGQPRLDIKGRGYREARLPACLLPGLAFYGDGLNDSVAERYVSIMYDWLEDMKCMRQMCGKDGGHGHAFSYSIPSGVTEGKTPALGLYAWDTATGSHFLRKEGIHCMRILLAYAQARNLATGKETRFGDCWPHGHFNPLSAVYRSGFAFLIPGEFKRMGDKDTASFLTWLLKGTVEKPKFNFGPLGFIFYDPTIPAKSPHELNLPLAEALGWDEEKGEIDRFEGNKAGKGWVCMRSSWEDKDATHAVFRAEPFHYGVHQHFDTLAFTISKREELALASSGKYFYWYEGGPLGTRGGYYGEGFPHMYYYFMRTISTNNLLIYNPKESLKWTKEGSPYGNDGGQRLWTGLRYTGEWKNRKEYGLVYDESPRDIGGLIRFERHKEYVYSAADGTPAYNSNLICSPWNTPKVSMVQREFVYLRSPDGEKDYFIVFDRVNSTQPEFKKIWLLHTIGKPVFDGDYKTAVGNEEGGIAFSENSSLVTISQKTARFFCKTLLPLPENRVINRLGGEVTTRLNEAIKATQKDPLDIEVDSTELLPDYPVVIIENNDDRDQNPFKSEVKFPGGLGIKMFKKGPNRPAKGSKHAVTSRECFFCEGKTPPGVKPARLIKCRRARNHNPSKDHPKGAAVIQGFRYLDLQGIERDDYKKRIDYPQAYGTAYDHFSDSPLYGMWRIEVLPKQPRKFDNFLHVLYPTVPEAEMPRTGLVESDEGSAYG
ncbi:MAG: hypothetical protein IMF01_05390, partial [Proteobacteria bacterium]|nr:hypothetical protein [Pseudomonadota bacterium]